MLVVVLLRANTSSLVPAEVGRISLVSITSLHRFVDRVRETLTLAVSDGRLLALEQNVQV